jgi:hypothetical protein
MTASECCPGLSGDSVKREDGQKYVKRSFGSYVILVGLRVRFGPVAELCGLSCSLEGA